MNGYPELQGSEKQVEWATRLRSELISAKQDTLNGMTRSSAKEQAMRVMGREKAVKMLTDNNATQAVMDAIVALFDTIDIIDTAKTTTSAKWIIDNRIQ